MIPTVVLAVVLWFAYSKNVAFTLLYFTLIFAGSHALHLAIAFKDGRPEKMSSNALLAMGLKFLAILVGSAIYFVTLEMERAGLVIVVLLYVYYMIVSAQFFYKN